MSSGNDPIGFRAFWFAPPALTVVVFIGCTFVFYQHQQRPFYTNRGIYMVAVQMVVLWLFVLGQVSYLIAVAANSRAGLKSAFLVYEFVESTVWFVFIGLMAYRFHILSFHNHIRQDKMNKEWEALLKGEEDEEHFGWYEAHAMTFGHPQWVWTRVGIPLMIVYALLCSYGLTSLSMMTLKLDGWLMTIVTRILTYAGLVCSLVITWRSMGGDVIGLRNELMMSVVWSFATVLTPFAWVIFQHFAQILLMDGVAMGWMMIVTVYVVYTNTDRSGEQDELMAANKTDDASRMWGVYVGQSRHHYQEFAKFLIREYSIENLLFLTEYFAYKEHFAIAIATLDHSSKINIQLPDEILKKVTKFSRLDDTIVNAAAEAEYLFDKYIEYNAPFTVNISYQQRDRLATLLLPPEKVPTGVMSGLKKSTRSLFKAIGSLRNSGALDLRHHSSTHPTLAEIIEALDAASMTLSSLLQDSFRRFKATDGYIDADRVRMDGSLPVLGLIQSPHVHG